MKFFEHPSGYTAVIEKQGDRLDVDAEGNVIEVPEDLEVTGTMALEQGFVEVTEAVYIENTRVRRELSEATVRETLAARRTARQQLATQLQLTEEQFQLAFQ